MTELLLSALVKFFFYARNQINQNIHDTVYLVNPPMPLIIKLYHFTQPVPHSNKKETCGREYIRLEIRAAFILIGDDFIFVHKLNLYFN